MNNYRVAVYNSGAEPVLFPCKDEFEAEYIHGEVCRGVYCTVEQDTCVVVQVECSTHGWQMTDFGICEVCMDWADQADAMCDPADHLGVS